MGNSRYDIFAILKPTLGEHTPKPSAIYAILERHGLNRLTPPMKQSKRRIIKTRAGELGHLDCHYLGKDQIVGSKQRSLMNTTELRPFRERRPRFAFFRGRKCRQS